MSIEFSCTQCGKQLRTPDNTAGRQAKCPQCGALTQIPHAAAFAPMPSAAMPSQSFPQAQPQPQSQAPGDEFNFNPYQSPSTTAAMYARGEQYGGAQLASLGARLGGALLDTLIGLAAVAPGFIYLLVASMADNNRGGMRGAALAGPFVLMGIGALAIVIVQWVMISQSGQSIGKRIVGTRIVRLDGSLPGFGYGVAMRNWVPGIISNIPYLGFLFAIANVLFIFGAERRCLHDHIAGTRVVQA
jgi:uncharacterized RDD family membrane protein YckC